MIFLSVSTSHSSFSLCRIWGQEGSLDISLHTLAPPIAIDCYYLLLSARLLCKVGFSSVPVLALNRLYMPVAHK